MRLLTFFSVLILIFCLANCSVNRQLLSPPPSCASMEYMGNDSAIVYDSRVPRAVSKRFFPNIVANMNGTIVMNLCIDRLGKVCCVDYNKEKSSIVDNAQVNEFIRSIYKTTFDPDTKAAELECGEWTINIERAK